MITVRYMEASREWLGERLNWQSPFLTHAYAGQSTGAQNYKFSRTGLRVQGGGDSECC